MSGAELQALWPLIIPALAGTAVMLAGAFGAGRRWLHRLALAGAGLAMLSIPLARQVAPRNVTPLLRIDSYALFFLLLLYAVTGVLVVISRPYLAARKKDPEAFYALLLFATTGMGVLACADHLAAFFLGLEILTVALYALIGYLRQTRASLEAALKYLVLAALSSGFLLFGIALIYAASGSLSLRPAVQAVLRLAPQLGRQPESAWAVAGALLLLAGFGFKLALVPFHMWSPDVYQGAPVPVTALIATGSKVAVLAVLLRLAGGASLQSSSFGVALTVIAVVTMFGGNLLALLQQDLKRLLAYSSIAHLGYTMVALVAGGRAGAEAVAFYLLVYVLMTLGAFAVVTVLSCQATSDVDSLQAYRGLGRRRPWLAGTLTLMLLSLAGIPPTAGFLAKFAILNAALQAGMPRLALATAVASGLALFYYLRVIVVLFMQQEATPAAPATATPGPTLPIATTLALVGLAATVVAIGLYPGPWLRAISAAVVGILTA
ncbi:MAG: NADH-quinone oxidoreductase subunit N [Acidobacteriota bacterium]